jgi:hypothetical protein
MSAQIAQTIGRSRVALLAAVAAGVLPRAASFEDLVGAGEPAASGRRAGFAPGAAISVLFCAA